MPTDLPIGSIIAMTVLRKIDTGYVLSAYGEEVLLHHNETASPLEAEQSVDVFLYLNKKGQVNATTYLPSVTLGLYDWADVVGVVPRLGVFVNIGTSKDILVSKDSLPLFQESWPRSGDRLYITLQLDKRGRLLGVPASENIIASNVFAAPNDLNQQTVIGTVYYTNKEGAAIITSDGYRGFIHRTERKEEPRVGQVIEGRVIAVKEDGSINVSLRPLKQDSLSADAEAILKHLEANNGIIPFHDKSDPEEIRATFQISKAAFKRAVGTLLKQGQIKQENEQIMKID